jgi:hypothetical protein
MIFFIVMAQVLRAQSPRVGVLPTQNGGIGDSGPLFLTAGNVIWVNLPVWGPFGGERRSPRRKRKTLEDPPRHARIRDGGDHFHSSATGRTTKRIDLEDPLQQIRPRDATSERFAPFGS